MTTSIEEYGEINLQREAPFPSSAKGGETLAGPGEAVQPTQGPVSPSTIDMAALAWKIYALLKKELRLESERQGRGDIW